ncbi:MAG: mitochondrial fission ELM1 family protein [Pseudomonadales bacterium]|nr:mitochondrial fission ELM1 family protein [Pseudomonadales bacterium]
MKAKNGPLQVLVIADGKPGHENQSLGLCEALEQYKDVQITHTRPLNILEATACIGLKRLPRSWKRIPAPDLVMGTGSDTHLSLIAAGRLYDAFITLLCSSSLPALLFDLNVVPEHDRYRIAGDIIRTKGVLNRVKPSHHASADRGLILIGGISDHYRWDANKVIEQVTAVIKEQPDIHWQLSNSRRTPKAMNQAFQQLPQNATFTDWQETGRDWLPKQLADSQNIWVTPDSVSMVYEALTSGNKVYLFSLKPLKTRVSRSIEKMRGSQTGTLTKNGKIKSATSPIKIWEADRIAKIILERLD